VLRRRARQGRVCGHPLYAERFKIVPTVYEYVDTGDEIGFRPIPDYPRDQVARSPAPARRAC
jgi:hypothetical protein